MKIDGNSPNANLRPLTPSTEETRVKSGGSTQQSGSASHGDTVELSSQARMVNQALQAATATPTIREDKVAEARLKLDAGEIGQDAEALANRLIDQMLEG
jgi:flagellar biosynthesis anti-sigma factor FlgM